MAGRTALYSLLPLTRGETTRFPRHPESLEESLFTGSYPRIFDGGLEARDWLRSYVATYVERDVRMLSNVGDLAAFQRFVALCAGRTAQLLNYSALAGDCGISQPTAEAWFSILETSFLMFRLPALRTNLRKRLVKMPKLHFYDTGLVCWLLGIRAPEQLRTHPLRGSIFEIWWFRRSSNTGPTKVKAADSHSTETRTVRKATSSSKVRPASRLSKPSRPRRRQPACSTTPSASEDIWPDQPGHALSPSSTVAINHSAEEQTP